MQKIIICFTGEPRALKKGLYARNKLLKKHKNFKFEIETRYIMSFLNDKKNENNKLKILERIPILKDDEDLKSIKFNDHKYDNIWTNLIGQKYEILCDLKKDHLNIQNTIILLTRTDWLFTKDTLNLINESINSKKIVIPFLTNNYSYFEGEKFIPIFDHFMVIPGNLVEDLIKALEISIQISLKQNMNDNIKNLKLGGNGKNRYGITPENLLGIGFKLSKLNKKSKVINDFYFKFPADMYGTNFHNLIRDDAHLWMNLSFKDFCQKYWWFIKTKICKFIYSFLKNK